MRVIFLDRPLKVINRYGFFIFLFSLWTSWKNFKVLSRSTQKWIHSPACSDHSLYGHKRQSFLPNRALKTPESQQLFIRLLIVSRIFQHPAIQTKIVQPFGWFFQQVKVHQPLGRKDSMQTVSRRLDSFLYEVDQNFEVFSNIQNRN
jgi:hypothetical protein